MSRNDQLDTVVFVNRNAHALLSRNGGQRRTGSKCRKGLGFDFGLGVNEQTGRLQWCPGLTCCKILIVLPVVMLPVTLVLILLMRMDGMLIALRTPPLSMQHQLDQQQAKSFGALYTDDYVLNEDNVENNNNNNNNNIENESENDYNDGLIDDIMDEKFVAITDKKADLSDIERYKRCINFKFGLSESVDIEERDIMKDSRTSFLPTDTTIIPSECLRPYGFGTVTPNNINNEEYSLKDWNDLKRSRRTSAPKNETVIDDDSFYANGEAYNSNAEADYSESDVVNIDSDVSIIDSTSAFKSFWNEEGTKDSIREAQAQTMLNYMDPSVSPCNDFFKYACGNWEKRHPIPKDKAGFDTFEMLRENLDAVLKQLLERDDAEWAKDEKEKVKDKSNHVSVDPIPTNSAQLISTVAMVPSTVPDAQIIPKNPNSLKIPGDSTIPIGSHIPTVPVVLLPLATISPTIHAAASTSTSTSEESDHQNLETNSDLRNPLPTLKPVISIGPIASAKVRGHIDYNTSPITSIADLEEQERARLRRNIISHRDKLSLILMRYRRQLTNSKRKRLFSSFDHKSNKEKSDIDEVVRKPKFLHTAQRKARDLYKSCTNTKVLQKRGIEPLLTLIEDLGGWPVLSPKWDEFQFDWLNLTAQLRTFNNDIFIVQWVGPDILNSDKNVIQLDQTSLGLPTREYFLTPVNYRYLRAYTKFMTEVLMKLGVSSPLAVTTAAELINFETQLAQITSPAEQRLNVTKLYKRMTLAELHKKVPAINWTRYLSILQRRNMESSEQVVIYAIEYMENLVSLLSITEPRTVANYLMWRFVRHRINNVDNRFEDIKQNFYHALFGREESPSRWKVCIAQVNTNMGMALGSMFVKKYFDENSKQDTLKMTHEIQQAFREILRSKDWLDGNTKHLSEMKVNAMSLKIGYPDFILNQGELNEKYEGIDIHPEKYFENTLNVLLHTARTEQSKLQESVNKTNWQTAPAVVNAYYSRNKNQIMFPAGILQPPFYHRHFPRSLNFGGIGVVIGHELTHGFDDKGRLFDRDGSIHKWWSDEAVKNFDERARCIIDQYSNYTVKEVGISLNGESTQGENIADNGGLRQAFHAYKRWITQNPQLANDERLPGIRLSGTQLFFLNFGQVWCGSMRPEAVRNKLNTAIHSPGMFRVIGSVSNSEDFAREFRCPRGSPMNPVRKCAVW